MLIIHVTLYRMTKSFTAVVFETAVHEIGHRKPFASVLYASEALMGCIRDLIQSTLDAERLLVETSLGMCQFI